MAKKVSAGLLMFRLDMGVPEVFIGHPGGPFFRKKDDGHWTIPKGEQDLNEDLLLTAIREFREETGINPRGPYIPLGFIKRKDGKVIHAWAFEVTNTNNFNFTSNNFELEWPPKSGKYSLFPELDKAEFFPIDIALIKINSVQRIFIEKLQQHLK